MHKSAFKGNLIRDSDGYTMFLFSRLHVADIIGLLDQMHDDKKKTPNELVSVIALEVFTVRAILLIIVKQSNVILVA